MTLATRRGPEVAQEPNQSLSVETILGQLHLLPPEMSDRGIQCSLTNTSYAENVPSAYENLTTR